MLSILTVHAVLSLGAVNPVMLPRLDTIVQVQPGARFDLEVGAAGGSVTIRAWERNEVSVESPRPLDFSASDNLVRLRGGRGNTGPFEITVPTWMPVEIDGLYVNVDIEGVEADVTVETLNGAIRISGADGRVSASTLQGRVVIEDTRGQVTASSANDLVLLERVTGPVVAEGVNAGVQLVDIDSEDVRAETVNGGVEFDGIIHPAGRYRFSSHNGVVRLLLAEGTNATIEVAVYNGELDASFPVELVESSRGPRMMLRVGDGSASIEASAFNGNVELRRPE